MGDDVGVYSHVERIGGDDSCRAWDPHRRRPVALSRVPPGAADLVGDTTGRLAGLTHPNVVAPIDLVNTADETTWLVEDWVDGVSVAELIGQGGLPESQGPVDMVCAVLAGLGAALERGVVHGNLTPSSVIVDSAGVPRITGYALHRATDENGFLSPEVLRGEPVVPASDVYSAAAVLAALLTGQPLFANGTPTEVVAAQVAREPDLSALPEPLQPVLSRALAPWPGQRPADARALLAELASATQAASPAPPLPPPPPPPSLPAPPLPPPRPPEERTGRRVRRALVATAAAAVLALIAVAAGLALLSDGDQPDPSSAPPAAAAKTVTPSPTEAASTPTPTLADYDWSKAQVPASACDTATEAAATTVRLRNGRGRFELMGAPATMELDLPPTYGAAGDATLAVAVVRCAIIGGNGAGGTGIVAFTDNTEGGAEPTVLGGVNNSLFGDVGTSGMWLIPTSVAVNSGQVVVQGNYLLDSDAACCPSGTGWTAVYLEDGTLVPSGIITPGQPPATLPEDHPRLIRYDNTGRASDSGTGDGQAPLLSDADAIRDLDDAPSDFVEAVTAELAELQARCPGGAVWVDRLRTDGYAAGGEVCQDAGYGSQTLWVRRDGSWRVLYTGEELPPCGALHRTHFPVDVYPAETGPVCATASGDFVAYTG